MVFSSLSFLYLFLPAVLLLHCLAPKKIKNVILLLFSLLFYYIGEQKLLIWMVASALCDYFCSLGIEQFRRKKAITKLFLCISLCLNLSLLGYFKYADLAISAFNSLTGSAVPLLRIALPIGISFYTFQTMSYTIDVYRGEIKATKNLMDFATYVTLFPQLVAGPIVRYETVAEELHERKITVSLFADGIRRFCVGLGKKVILANSLASFVALYDSSQAHTVLFAWMAAVCIPLQIYFDFSGYSDMAVGLGAMLGFHFPENFRYPLISRSATEFWRRWHMTLGTWFRDYIYFPLGGNRCSHRRHIFNLLAVWLITGLWHGAAYNYILWGLYYGLILILEKYVLGTWLAKHSAISRIYFALLTVFGFMLFHTEDLTLFPQRISELLGIGASALVGRVDGFYIISYLPLLLIAVFCATPIGVTVKQRIGNGRAASACRYVEGILCMGLLLVSTAYLVDGSYNPFLYFRF